MLLLYMKVESIILPMILYIMWVPIYNLVTSFHLIGPHISLGDGSLYYKHISYNVDTYEEKISDHYLNGVQMGLGTIYKIDSHFMLAVNYRYTYFQSAKLSSGPYYKDVRPMTQQVTGNIYYYF